MQSKLKGPQEPSWTFFLSVSTVCACNFQPSVLSHLGTSLPHQMCCVFSILLTMLYLVNFWFPLFLYFPLRQWLSFYLLPNYQTIFLWVPCCELAHASTELVGCQVTVHLVVREVHHWIPFLDFMPWLPGWENHPASDVRGWRLSPIP